MDEEEVKDDSRNILNEVLDAETRNWKKFGEKNQDDMKNKWRRLMTS
jgi:hypothetical protein